MKRSQDPSNSTVKVVEGASLRLSVNGRNAVRAEV